MLTMAATRIHPKNRGRSQSGSPGTWFALSNRVSEIDYIFLVDIGRLDAVTAIIAVRFVCSCYQL